MLDLSLENVGELIERSDLWMSWFGNWRGWLWIEEGIRQVAGCMCRRIGAGYGGHFELVWVEGDGVEVSCAVGFGDENLPVAVVFHRGADVV